MVLFYHPSVDACGGFLSITISRKDERSDAASTFFPFKPLPLALKFQSLNTSLLPLVLPVSDEIQE